MACLNVLLLAVFCVLFQSAFSQTCNRNNCYDNVNNRCRPKGRLNKWTDTIDNGFKVTKFCRIREGVKSIRIIAAECPSPGGMLANGDSWNNETSCYKYKCVLRKNGTVYQVKLKTMSIGCPANGQCIAKGQTWTEQIGDVKITRRCRHVGGVRKPYLMNFQCAWNDRWIDMGSDEILQDPSSCNSYKCPTKRWARKNGFGLKTVARGCNDNGECRKRGRDNRWNVTSSNFIVTKQCKIKPNSKQIDTVKFYCNSPDGFVAQGAIWDDSEKCRKYKCKVTTEVKDGIEHHSIQTEDLGAIGCNIQGHGCILNGKEEDVLINGKTYKVGCRDGNHYMA